MIESVTERQLKQIRRLDKCKKVALIPGATRYAITSMGNVYSLVSGKPKQLTKGFNSWGYVIACVYDDGGRKRSVRVHRLVAELFVKPYDGVFACHRDDDRKNNTASNIYWGDASTNALDAARNHGRKKLGKSERKLIRSMLRLGVTWLKTAENIGCSVQAVYGEMRKMRQEHRERFGL